MNCTQCGEISKYKCPTCKEPYCSVECCKKHKEVPCSAPPPSIVHEAETIEATYDYPTEDTVPLDKLKLLDNSVELKKCLENPHVRQILQQLDKATHPEELLQEYMLEPIFTELVDECLKIVEPQDNEKVYM